MSVSIRPVLVTPMLRRKRQSPCKRALHVPEEMRECLHAADLAGCCSHRHEKLGSVSRDVLGAARCSVIAVKVRPQGTTVSC